MSHNYKDLFEDETTKMSLFNSSKQKFHPPKENKHTNMMNSIFQQEDSLFTVNKNNSNYFQKFTKHTFKQEIIMPSELGLQNLFNFDAFNPVQKECLEDILKSNTNMLISAPTSSGKTVLFELAIVKAFGGPTAPLVKDRLVIYICPNKALCQEKIHQWKSKFERVWSLIEVVEYTSDSDHFNNFKANFKLPQSGIVIGTPEKINHMLRQWKFNRKIINNICLFMVDEIHLLEQESRGMGLESMITRLKFLKQMKEFSHKVFCDARIMAVSATLGNIHEIAEWLEVPPKFTKIFGKEYRPIQLKKKVLGYNCNSNQFLFDKYLNFKLPDLIKRYSDNKSCLIFVSTRKSAVASCQKIIEFMSSNREYLSSQRQIQELIAASQSIDNSDLKYFLPYGIGFHHSSLTVNDRQVVEMQFKKNNVKVLVTTSTLAQGVNLPAYLVIIKGTKGYRGQGVGKGYTDLRVSELFQMMGRAGRPQYDTSGMVIIMTEKNNMARIEQLVNGDLKDILIKSYFEDGLGDILNSEIASKTIKNYPETFKYFQNSLLYIQMKNNNSPEV
jgi:ATP-dependent DNA helicase HFM1/MER3